jgi:hypothetical protein
MHTYTVQGITHHTGGKYCMRQWIYSPPRPPPKKNEKFKQRLDMYEMLGISYSSFEISYIHYEGKLNTDCNNIRLYKLQRPTKVQANKKLN